MMEKNALYPSHFATEELVKTVPLPNELPPGIDFSELPAIALKASTLETVINQNEDLMARLSVALRRVNLLEDRVAKLQSEREAYRSRFEGLHEQHLVLKEKDRLIGTRSLTMQEENQELKIHLNKLEKSYTDVYIQAQTFQRNLAQLERYRARIARAAKSVQARAKHADTLENKVSLLEQNLEDARNQIQLTTSGYESKLKEVRFELDALQTKLAERNDLYEEKVKIENQMIYEQRQFEIQRLDAHTHAERLEKTIQNLNQENSDLRLQVKDQLISMESAERTAEQKIAAAQRFEDESKRLQEQVESLQALWEHKQKEIEALTEKNASLQRLNQSISLTLNQQRKEIHSVKGELERERHTSQEKIKTLLTDIQMLRNQMIEGAGSGTVKKL